MQKLVVIDGNAILHRAYHALPPLTDSKGEVVNAVYGFFSMLLKVISEKKPDYLAVCFDRSKPTVRQSMYVGYHAHRPQLPDDFATQIGKVDEVLEKMKVNIYAVDGYEADDVIGTISRIDAREDIETIIVTGDRDLLQLVDKHTKVLMLITGMTKTLLFDEAAVEEKYGVHPRQFIDFKALVGDASDGYPGVTGIGPKTAANLLQKFKTFEGLYEHLNEVPEKQRMQLATDAEQAVLAKKLATIIRDVPLQFNHEDCSSKNFDIHGLQQAFEKLNFKSLNKRLTEIFLDFREKKKSRQSEGQMELL